MGKRFNLIPFRGRLDATAAPFQKHHQKIFENIPPNSWVGIFDGEIIGVGGEAPFEDGLGVWVLFTDKITPKGFFLIDRAFRRLIKDYKNQNIKLIMHVDPSYEQSGRWAGLLGFSDVGMEEIEGRVMKRFEQ